MSANDPIADIRLEGRAGRKQTRFVRDFVNVDAFADRFRWNHNPRVGGQVPPLLPNPFSVRTRRHAVRLRRSSHGASFDCRS